ncbi:MAG: GNAT family N-acetyltransferase, partial [bacterium]|nr:GNAT family N-acetyltransferase [bacterium]
VAQKGKEILGCSSLHLLWDDLAEVRGVAVKEDYHGKGVGRALIGACLQEAKDLGIARVFLLTNKPDYFSRFDFEIVPKKRMPQKIWGECINCPKFPEYCDEVAMMKNAKQNGKRS